MRGIKSAALVLVLMGVAVSAQARTVTKHDIQVCKWGAGVAGHAQQSKLAGTTLYSARTKLKAQHFSKPWMPRMALGITEQTYASRSRLKPAAVSKTYYDGCIKHDMARK